MPPRVNSPTATDQLAKDEYVFLREEMRHEDNLINARLKRGGLQSFVRALAPSRLPP